MSNNTNFSITSIKTTSKEHNCTTCTDSYILYIYIYIESSNLTIGTCISILICTCIENKYMMKEYFTVEYIYT